MTDREALAWIVGVLSTCPAAIYNGSRVVWLHESYRDAIVTNVSERLKKDPA